jgi:hypothetical protein
MTDKDSELTETDSLPTQRSRYVPIYRNDENELNVVFDKRRDVYLSGTDMNVLLPEGEEVDYEVAMWPSEFSQKTGWLDTRSPAYMLYEQEGSYPSLNPRSTERSQYKHHIVKDDKGLCMVRNSFYIPQPEDDSLTPVERLENKIKTLRSERICKHCRREVIEPEILADGEP